MDIAGASVSLGIAQARMGAAFAVTGKAMDTAEVQAQGLLEMMETAVPSFGGKMDIRV